MIVSAFNFICPSCESHFGEEELQQLMGEPFNGYIAICPICKKEFSCNILIDIGKEVE